MKRSFLPKALMLVISLGLTFVLLEGSLRVLAGEYNFNNFLKHRLNLFRAGYPVAFDAQLGWVPEIGKHPLNIWNTRVTIAEPGVRSNGEVPAPTREGFVLVVGDSFTFGDEVSDHETWPAQLQAQTGLEVINGGVFGYGVDQSYFRLKALLQEIKSNRVGEGARVEPSAIIFSFIPDDVRRCEFSERTSIAKPYFDRDEGSEAWVLQRNHIHFEKKVKANPSLGRVRDVLGYSFLAHTLMLGAFPEYWLTGQRIQGTRVHPKGTGVEIAAYIFDEIEAFARSTGIDVYILVQYGKDGFEKQPGWMASLLASIDTEVITLVDLSRPFKALKASNPQRYEVFFRTHMTAAGNAWVASQLAPFFE